MNRVACSFSIYNQDPEMFPHLYDHDIEKLVEIRDKCIVAEDADIKEIGVAINRALDWISAESRSVSNTIRMSAVRSGPEDVSVFSSDMMIEGRGDNVLGALQDCVNQMVQTAYELAEISDDENDTVGYKDRIMGWIEKFPVVENNAPLEGESDDE